MKHRDKNYSKQIEVSASAKQVFQALNEGLNTWWGKITHSQFKANGQFTITFENGNWWVFKIVGYSPNNKLIWKCIDGEPDFNKEWIGHVLHWKIEENKTKRSISFHQKGLTPDVHCYDVCSSTWDMFISEKLKTYLNSI